MEEYNKSYGANNHTSLLSHAQSHLCMDGISNNIYVPWLLPYL